MVKPVELLSIRNITVSGRIASGQTTLAKSLGEVLGWRLWEGGAIAEKYYIEELNNNDEVDVDARPDSNELWMDDFIKKMLATQKYQIIQSNLAGFNAQNIEGVYKILTVCENNHGVDQVNIRIDRLANRKGVSMEQAKRNVIEREKKNRDKWSRLYCKGDPDWVYWDKRYYDLIVNTYSLSKSESVNLVLSSIKFVKD